MSLQCKMVVVAREIWCCNNSKIPVYQLFWLLLSCWWHMMTLSKGLYYKSQVNTYTALKFGFHFRLQSLNRFRSCWSWSRSSFFITWTLLHLQQTHTWQLVGRLVAGHLCTKGTVIVRGCYLEVLQIQLAVALRDCYLDAHTAAS